MRDKQSLRGLAPLGHFGGALLPEGDRDEVQRQLSKLEERPGLVQVTNPEARLALGDEQLRAVVLGTLAEGVAAGVDAVDAAAAVDAEGAPAAVEWPVLEVVVEVACRHLEHPSQGAHGHDAIDGRQRYDLDCPVMLHRRPLLLDLANVLQRLATTEHEDDASRRWRSQGEGPHPCWKSIPRSFAFRLECGVDEEVEGID
mmetsp:Transcript_35874/g.102471  ORF Transcript_35874/g.102471 Transcript_35874/m.102471 type:complete len:200 (+) Transcript_35874:722-1321(+)